MRPATRAATSGAFGVVRDRLAMWYDPSNSACYPGSGTSLTTLYEDDRVDPTVPLNTFSGTVNSGVVQTVAGQTSFKASGGSAAYCNTNIPFQQDWWLDCWLYFNTAEAFGNMFGTGTYGTSLGLHIVLIGTNFNTCRFGMYSNDTDFVHGMVSGNWYHLAFSYLDSSPYTKRMWVNGTEIVGSQLQTQLRWGNSNRSVLSICKSYDITTTSTTTYGTMGMAVARHYLGETASDAVVRRNFSAERARFGV